MTSPIGEVRVIDPGFLTTVQDARGRPGLGRYGIAPGGAVDAAAALLANRLVGNDGDEPVLEITLHGPTLEWMSGAHIGLAGADLGTVSRGLRLVAGHSYRLAPGSTLGFESVAPVGARAYIAVEGGFAIARVLGSAATDRRSGFGGHDGRSLAAGDVLRFAAGQNGPLRSATGAGEATDDPLHLVASPAGLGWFAQTEIDRFCATAWTVAPESDRTGIRLSGAPVAARTNGIPSLGVPVGSVQVPPSGEPIITLVDGPVTGGYPVIGLVPRLDHARLAQAAPGTILRFRRATIATVRRLGAARASAAADRDGIVLDEGDLAAGWAG